MKKLFLILISIMVLLGCSKNYKCIVEYNLVYPDTTYVNTYSFVGNSDSHVNLYSEPNGKRKMLVVFPHGGAFGDVIAVSPTSESDIVLKSFKMFYIGDEKSIK